MLLKTKRQLCAGPGILVTKCRSSKLKKNHIQNQHAGEGGCKFNHSSAKSRTLSSQNHRCAGSCFYKCSLAGRESDQQAGRGDDDTQRFSLSPSPHSSTHQLPKFNRSQPMMPAGWAWVAICQRPNNFNPISAVPDRRFYQSLASFQTPKQ